MKVFISYAGTDRDLAKRVARALRQAGLDVWLFDEQVLPGENWAARIAQGLEAADVIVSLLTPSALQSRMVRHELDYALGEPRLAGRLIPVWRGPAATMETDDFPWILRRLNLIHLAAQEQSEEELNRIVQAVQACA